ncbi:hypothetical protein B0A50_03941 [Salinomyces thailandicus]|uniref:Uncharacterized protein n=1 Tax=Salinomyces thailandicus TaxID=706561 RepID=A0A4U0U1A5_9PEZI|nr:hypothetical protein B0A50_03941 [Salinomyces thailandica]
MRRSPSLAVQTRSPDLRSSALGDIREAENKPSTTSEKHDSPMSVMAPRPIPRTPRLDLDIPNAQLERYSVMFEKLLEPRQSILERRQSKAKRTRPVRKDGLNMPNIDKSLPEKPPASYPDTPQRSATSPHPQRAPSLQIRVAKQQRTPAAEPVNATALPLQRPIKRSNTAPPAAASPIAPNFSRPKAQTFSTTVSDHSPISPLSAEDSLPPTPTTVTTVTDTDSIVQPFSRLEQSTPTTSRQYPNNEKASPIPAIPTLSSPASQAGPSHHVRPPYPSVTSPEDLERQIIQVSVARQVSVSNARRQVEEATATSKQPMRPRVVELGRYRKSTVVLIESADE